jgi:hypothetical protein
MKKIIALGSLLAVMFMLPNLASAQATSSGTLEVTATIDSSISMVFDKDASGVALTDGGSAAAVLAFGHVSAYNSVSSDVTRTVDGVTDYVISTPFDVKVTQANGSSANFTLTGQLNAVDTANTWEIGIVPVTSASPASITATGAYGSDVSYTLALTIPFSEIGATVIDNTINFEATAN